jgi:AcrR family transcriptional regulator
MSSKEATDLIEVGASSPPKSRKGQRGPNTAGERAKAELLAVAISMFAELGYGGVSTRELTKQAGVNQASIYYHFRTKRDVYMAAVIKCFEAVDGERLRLLEAIETNADASLDDILRAFIAPHVRYVTTREGQDYLRIFATFSATPEDILSELYEKHFGPSRQRFIDATHRVEPNIDKESLHRAFGIIANMIVSSLFDHGYKATTGKSPYKVKVEPFIDRLVAYNAAGIRALAALS